MIKVMIVDDHPVVREGFEAMIESTKGFEVVASAADGEKALARVLSVKPDIAVLDMRLPGMDGIATFEAMRRKLPDIKAVILAGMPLKVELERARKAGAQGYLPKNVDNRRLIASLKAAVEGAEFQQETLPEVPCMLSPREMECLKYLALGKTREEVKIIMGVTFETVRTFVKSIQMKLDAPNTAGAVSRAYELGILRP